MPGLSPRDSPACTLPAGAAARGTHPEMISPSSALAVGGARFYNLLPLAVLMHLRGSLEPFVPPVGCSVLPLHGQGAAGALQERLGAAKVTVISPPDLADKKSNKFLFLLALRGDA